MAQDSKIEWTHHTINLWWGCTEVHEGCDNCYARVFAHRDHHKTGVNLWGAKQPRLQIKSAFSNLLKFQKLAAKAQEIHRVFVGSMMDIFERPMPLVHPNKSFSDTGELRNILFANISAEAYPNLQFLFLTKRPSNINKYIPESWKTNPPPNVMFGTSPVNQETADKLIPQLLSVNGKRFLSVEPQLSEIYIVEYLKTGGIHWVIQGGESGPKKRPFHPGWGSSMMAQCDYTKVPFFFKQIDKVSPIPAYLQIREFPV